MRKVVVFKNFELYITLQKIKEDMQILALFKEFESVIEKFKTPGISKKMELAA